MNSRLRALKQIAELRETYCEPDSAYVARSRLKRVLLSTLRLAAEASGADGPETPGPFRLPINAPHNARELVTLCNEAFVTSVHLCQPSEALDVRWTAGWNEVGQHLQEIERCLNDWSDVVVDGSTA